MTTLSTFNLAEEWKKFVNIIANLLEKELYDDFNNKLEIKIDFKTINHKFPFHFESASLENKGDREITPLVDLIRVGLVDNPERIINISFCPHESTTGCTVSLPYKKESIEHPGTFVLDTIDLKVHNHDILEDEMIELIYDSLANDENPKIPEKFTNKDY